MQDDVTPPPGMRFSFDTGASPAMERPPLRILAMAELGEGTAGRPVTVDKDSFGRALEQLAGTLRFEVANHLARRPEYLQIHLPIVELRSFTPAGIAERVPDLKRAVEFRDRLREVARGRVSLDELAAELPRYEGLSALAEPLRLCQDVDSRAAAPTPTPAAPAPVTPQPPAAGGDDPLDRLLSMVDAPAAREPAADALAGLHQVIADIGSSGAQRRPVGRLAEAVTLTETIIARQLDAILHHPTFRTREAAWRGVKFLVDHTDFRADIRLEVLDAPRGELAERFRRHIYEPELEGRNDTPLGLVVAAYEVDNHPTDLEWLQGVGEQAGDLQVPVLTALDPAFFGLADAGAAGRMAYPGGLLDAPAYAKWNALRDKEASRWLTVCFNPFLLRQPHDAAQRRGIGIAETATAAELLWGNPVWAVAALVAASQARCGWPTEITGADNGRLEGLEMHTLDDGAAQPVQIPTAALLGEQLAEDLAAAGIVPLLCRADRDAVYVLRAPGLHRPEVYGDEQATAASRAMGQLPYQLLLARLADAVARHKAALTVGHDVGTIRSGFERLAAGLLAGTGPGAGAAVEVGPDPARVDGHILSLHLRTGRNVLNGADVRLAFPV